MDEKRYYVNVSPDAIVKFAEHVEFLARINENAALSLIDSYEEALSVIEESPEICPPYYPCILIDAELRYKLFGKWYRIVFEILGNDVFAYDIQDCRRDIDKNLI